MYLLDEAINNVPCISVITQIEALSWINPDKTKEAIIKDFINDAHIIPLTPDIVNQCIKIRRSRKIKTPDAIIAATAIVHNLVLLTNDSGILQIEHLQSLDPHLL